MGSAEGGRGRVAEYDGVDALKAPTESMSAADALVATSSDVQLDGVWRSPWSRPLGHVPSTSLDALRTLQRVGTREARVSATATANYSR